VPSAARRFLQHFAAAVEVAAERPDYGQGLRAATVTVLPLLLGALTHHPGFIWVALAGWLATFADQGGSYQTRFEAMGAYTVAASVAFAAASILGMHPLLAVAALFAVALYATLARVYGDTASAVGSVVLLSFCIGLGLPQPGLREAALRGALWACGGGLAMLVALGLWPVHPYKPVRFAVAHSYTALARFVEAMARLGGEPSQERWHDMARTERKAVREALEKARATLVAARDTRSGGTPRGEQLLVLYELAEQALGELSGLSEALQRRAERGEAPPASEQLAKIGEAFDAIAAAVPANADPKPVADAEVRFDDEAASLLRRAARTARLAYNAAARLRDPSARPALDARRNLAAPPLRRMRDALSLSSFDLRHALRVATAVAAAQATGEALQLRRIHWITVTVVLLLQPHPGATTRKTLQRVGGTTIGAVAATLLSPLVHSPLWASALLFPLSMGAIALRPLNYGLFAALVTPVFVLMAESSSPNGGLVMARILNTLIGGAISLLAAHFLWPSWEREQVPGHLAAVLEAERSYLRAIATQGHDARAVAAARRQFGLAHANAEASFQRLLAEPNDPEKIEAIMSLLAWSRRLAGSANALWPALERERPGAADTLYAAALDRALAELAEAAAHARVPAAREPPPEGSALGPAMAGNLEAMERQLDGLSSAVARLARTRQ
jgi:uncharacterized membrane protein YccC